MAKKKGRPPKSPSPHTPSPTKIPKTLDLQHIDDEDLEDIDALSPKKAASILQKLDELRSRIKGKVVADDPKATDEPIEEQPDAHSLTAKENIQEYSIKEGYEYLIGELQVFNHHRLIWNPVSISKHNFILWLLAHDSLRMKDNLPFLQASPLCELCAGAEETRSHLFFDCAWSRQLIEEAGNWIKDIDLKFSGHSFWDHLGLEPFLEGG
ncbi:hypothetical protein RIF29_19908 [Crotalaria pallida]|uniref:Reverse transcriptase zinc-binding domain-containing protein n=1 Tax=Crotalaria pallida TaxID=3830 RepID=A0AAN9F3G7_CROPI